MSCVDSEWSACSVPAQCAARRRVENVAMDEQSYDSFDSEIHLVSVENVLSLGMNYLLQWFP